MTVVVFDMQTAAEYLGIGKATLKTHRQRGSFPTPFMRFGRTPVWAQSQLDEWQHNRPGKPGRPPKPVAGESSKLAQQTNERDES